MMTMDYYILKDRKAVKVTDVLVWAKFLETKERIVEQTDLDNGTRVSTVFLGIDHSFSFGGDDEPLLYETMIFGNVEYDDYQERCSTWEQAEKMHEKALRIARGEEIE